MALSSREIVTVSSDNENFKEETARISEAVFSLNYIKNYFDEWEASTKIGEDVMNNYIKLVNALDYYIEGATETYNKIAIYCDIQTQINEGN